MPPIVAVPILICWNPVLVLPGFHQAVCGRLAVAIVRLVDGHEEGRCQLCLSDFARRDTPSRRFIV